MVLNLERLGISQLSTMQQQMQYAFDASVDDIILLSPTGSGKTLAYLLPLLPNIQTQTDRVQVIIIVPSRELATQTDAVVKSLKTPVRSLALYGGRPTMDECRLFLAQHPHVLIATPGRLLDHLHKRHIFTTAVNLLILDEFDKCIEIGFQSQLQEIIQRLSAVSRRILLSATDNPHIPQFIRAQHIQRLDFLKVDSHRTVFQVQSSQKDKLQTLYGLLCTLGSQQTIVFLNYREAVERTAQVLRQQGVYGELYHGALEQDRRERALCKFMNGSCNVLFTTDLGSRGLVFPDVDNIVHYHLPLNSDAYVHRNGRTGRGLEFAKDGGAGAKGMSHAKEKAGRIFFISHDEEELPEYVDASDVQPFYLSSQLEYPSVPRMSTIYIGKGKRQKISRGDIVGLLCKIGGITSADIGRIDVRDHCSYAAVLRQYLHDVLKRLEGQKIKGIKTIFREAK